MFGQFTDRAFRAVARVAAAGALSLAALGALATPSPAASLSLEQWSAGYVSFIGGGSTGPASPRVQFLEKWATVEGTFYLGNVYNPLDTEMPASGAGMWNGVGVRTYPSLTVGYQATLATMQQSYDAPILAALRSRASSLPSLTRALADSNWTGYGPLSSDESGYAGVVGGAPAGPAGPVGPTEAASAPSPSPASGGGSSSTTAATIRGVIVNPLGQGLDGVCVAAIPNGGLAVNAVTSTGGVFRLEYVPETDVRLRITDCHFLEGGATPSYYDAGAGRRRTVALASRSTVINLTCHRNCANETYRLRASLVYGTVAVPISWPHPAAITYGAALSPSELDASSPVRGVYSYTPTLGALLSAGTHTISLTFTPTDHTDYRVAESNVPLAVSRATPSVSWSVPDPITYGTTLSSSELDATASVAGSFSYLYPSTTGSVLRAGAESLHAMFVPSDTTDYADVSASVPLTVDPAVPSLSLTSSATVAAGSTLSSSQLRAHASVPGTFTYSPPLGTAIPAGSEAVSVAFRPTDDADYLSTEATVTLDGAQATPTITWSKPRSVAAGTELSATQLDAHASVSGTFSYSPGLGTVPSPGTDTLSVTFTPTNTVAYAPVSAETSLVVAAPLAPTLTGATPAPVPAGTALSATQLDARASVPGTFAYTPALGTVTSPGTDTLSVTFTPANTAAYSTATAETALLVAPLLTPVISWATPTSVLAGTALSATQLDARASVPGTFVYTPGLGSVLGAGNDVLSVTFTPTNAAAYAVVSDRVSIAVLPTSTTTTAPTTSTTTTLPSTTVLTTPPSTTTTT